MWRFASKRRPKYGICIRHWSSSCRKKERVCESKAKNSCKMCWGLTREAIEARLWDYTSSTWYRRGSRSVLQCLRINSGSEERQAWTNWLIAEVITKAGRGGDVSIWNDWYFKWLIVLISTRDLMSCLMGSFNALVVDLHYKNIQQIMINFSEF